MVDPMCGVGTILLEAAQEHKVRTALYGTGVFIDCFSLANLVFFFWKKK